MRIVFQKETEAQLIALAKQSNIYIEGNLLKVVDTVDSTEFDLYVKEALEKDSENRRKRLEVTRQVQNQNKELKAKALENEELMADLKSALETAENAKQSAINDLDVMQKRTQFELIGNIVNYALYVIVGTGIITTTLYVTSILLESPETTLIGNTWSNLFGILLTNSFSIIGTIMGVKYANSNKEEENR